MIQQIGEVLGWLAIAAFGVYFVWMLYVAVFDPTPSGKKDDYLHDVNSESPQEEGKDAQARR